MRNASPKHTMSNLDLTSLMDAATSLEEAISLVSDKEWFGEQSEAH